MRLIRGKDTTPEMIVRQLIHQMGLRFRLHRKDLPGKPDVVLPKLRTVVFIHGCFWHGHNCKKGSGRRRPKSNTAYWNKKLDRNSERDAEHARELRTLGWTRVVVWACETANPVKFPDKCVAMNKPSGTRHTNYEILNLIGYGLAKFESELIAALGFKTKSALFNHLIERGVAKSLSHKGWAKALAVRIVDEDFRWFSRIADVCSVNICPHMG